MSAAVPKSSVRESDASGFGRPFLEHILRQIPEVEDPHTTLRQQARAQLAELGIPTPAKKTGNTATSRRWWPTPFAWPALDRQR